VNSPLQRLRRAVYRAVWRTDPAGAGWPGSWLIVSGRFLWALLRDMFGGQLTLRAMGLVYATLLALVPLLALSFSVLKGFGAHNQIEPLLSAFLAPLGPGGAEISTRIISFVDNVKALQLGAYGLLLLMVTVVLLIQKIESAFAYIWHVRRARSFGQAFSVYLSVILIGPVLMFTAIGLTASVMSHAIVQQLLALEPFGTLAYLAGRLMPYVLVCGTFTFVYLFIPNTRVRFGAGLTGGVFAGIAWQAVGWAFAAFVVSSTRYEAIYSGFAIVIVFIIWVYVSWMILLMGAQMAFYAQFPFALGPRHTAGRAAGAVERAGMTVMYLVAGDYLRGEPARTGAQLAETSGLDAASVEDALAQLQAANLLVVSEDGGYLPARDIDAIGIKDVWNAVHDGPVEPAGTPGLPDAVAGVLSGIDSAIGGALEGRSLRDLLLAEGQGKPPPPAREPK